LSWLTLLLLAQWFFGNLYEAIAFAPNAMSFIELKGRAGEALFNRKIATPVAYYVPSILLALVLAPILSISSVIQRNLATPYIPATTGLLIAGVGLTVYAVRYINLDLFFRPQTDLIRAGRLLHTWTILNNVRLLIAAASLVTTVLWIRAIIQS
jgi:hypothetical protein